jgi:integrase
MTHGSGTITPRRDKLGAWIRDGEGRPLWDLLFYDATGKKRHLRRHFATKKEAADWITLQREAEPDADSPTWRELHQAWENAHRDLSASQIDKVARTIRRLVEHIGENTRFGETTGEAVRSFVAGIGTAHGTVAARHALGHLKSIARWARGQLLLGAVSPWEHLAQPKHKGKKKGAVPLEEIPGLVNDLDPWLRPIVLWICATGCRQQDAGRLLEEDIAEDRARMTVKASRTFDYLLDDSLRAILAAARELKAGAGFAAVPFVFCRSTGKPWAKDPLSTAIRRAWKGKPWRLHALRHTFGTIAGKKFKADMVKSGMAHLSRQTSERYVHLDEDAEARLEVGAHVRDVLGKAGVRVLQNRTSGPDFPKGTEGIRKNPKELEVEVEGVKCLIPKEIALQYRIA